MVKIYVELKELIIIISYRHNVQYSDIRNTPFVDNYFETDEYSKNKNFIKEDNIIKFKNSIKYYYV